MTEDRITWDETWTRELRGSAAPVVDGGRRLDVYEEWLAATKIAYTQGG